MLMLVSRILAPLAPHQFPLRPKLCVIAMRATCIEKKEGGDDDDRPVRVRTVRQTDVGIIPTECSPVYVSTLPNVRIHVFHLPGTVCY